MIVDDAERCAENMFLFYFSFSKNYFNDCGGRVIMFNSVHEDGVDTLSDAILRAVFSKINENWADKGTLKYRLKHAMVCLHLWTEFMKKIASFFLLVA